MNSVSLSEPELLLESELLELELLRDEGTSFFLFDGCDTNRDGGSGVGLFERRGEMESGRGAIASKEEEEEEEDGGGFELMTGCGGLGGGAEEGGGMMVAGRGGEDFLTLFFLLLLLGLLPSPCLVVGTLRVLT